MSADDLQARGGLTARLTMPPGSDPDDVTDDVALLIGGAIGILDAVEQHVDGTEPNNALWSANLLLRQALSLALSVPRRA